MRKKIKTTVLVLLSLWLIISFPSLVIAEDQLPKPTDVNGLIVYYAKQYNVSADTMIGVIKCESSFIVDVQSRATYKSGNKWGFPEGTREKSFGLSQIHLPDHTEISYEQAIDPDFAIEFLAKQLSVGNGKMWTCYRTLHDK